MYNSYNITILLLTFISSLYVLIKQIKIMHKMTHVLHKLCIIDVLVFGSCIHKHKYTYILLVYVTNTPLAECDRMYILWRSDRPHCPQRYRQSQVHRVHCSFARVGHSR